ncbi:unnamed protein product [Phytophthora lilii]|uniref:Fucosyltransferase n=1 Tax=Phytophthora lilii TaxID=2077276 RepID=A0A9W6WWB5_9STRA|nr:unnamed protein product [Phytophthora lilii]
MIRRGEVDDPVVSLKISSPADGAVERPPVKLTTEINVRPEGVELFNELYEQMNVCFEVNNATFKCTQVNEEWMAIQLWDLGEYVVRAYFSDGRSGDGERHWLSTPVKLTIVSDAAYKSRDGSANHMSFRAGYDISLIDWAEQQQRLRPREVLKKLENNDVGIKRLDGKSLEPNGPEDLVLLIGVKTAIATNFALRQAIRETWASEKALPRGAKVLFVGCRPFFRVEQTDDGIVALNCSESDAQGRRLRNAIALEKMVYGDLLTDELDCNDAYRDLANKVKEFLHVAATQYSRAQYVMITDDDVYVRADQLVRRFVSLGPQKRYYRGQMPSVQHGRKDIPTRDPRLRIDLPVDLYPLSEVPPMTMGAYFFLSMDCAKFVSKNRRRLRDLAGMDDITIPLWMLSIQVHAHHQADLGYLRADPCNNSLVAFGDLSVWGIREIHENIQMQRPFCHEFDQQLWLKSSAHAPREGLYRALPWFPESLQFDFVLVNPHRIGPLQIMTTISTSIQAGVKICYFPSNETFRAYSYRVCAEARLRFPSSLNSTSCDEISILLKARMKAFYAQVQASVVVDQPQLSLWKHNMDVDDRKQKSPVIVAYSARAVYSVSLFECLFASMNYTRPILVVDELTLYRRYGGQPDVFIFSILDGDCEYYMKPGCQRMVAEYVHRYYRSNEASTSEAKKPCTLIMFSGEAWNLEDLDERVLLISTVAGVPRDKHVYLSFASASFVDRLTHNPTALLVSQGVTELSRENTTRKFCAYMYRRCDRPERELMYDLLNEVEPVDALGKCSGSTKHVDLGAIHKPERYSDDAVKRYESYKFVIAFENSQASGYVTEKLIDAFLAGSLPIYYGNSTTVAQLFNTRSFIDCGAHDTLEDCARYVIKVHKSSDLYEAFLKEPPITDVEAFLGAFSWHPAVASRFHADAVKRLLAQF